MRHAARVTMSMRELDRLKCIQAVVDGDLSLVIVAERLGISTRQLRRIAQRYRAEGPNGLISRRCSRPSNNRLDASLEVQVVKILRESYPDFGPTLAAEKLQQRHGITVAKETIRRVQMDAGLWIPRKLRPPKVQQPRARRACFGELIQIDGCEHRWFEHRAPMCTALVYVDDATSRLMIVRFAGSESTFAYFEATLQYLKCFGKPLAFYSDKASIFRINQPGAITGPGYTQFGRALYELNIDEICANTAAAKGRVERAHLTLQDRLVKELRLEGISSIEAANAFMPRFINDYNERFAKEPRNTHNTHRAVRADEDLDSIFSWRELRKVTKALTLHYEQARSLTIRSTDIMGNISSCFSFRPAASRSEQRGSHCPTPRTTSWVRSTRERSSTTNVLDTSCRFLRTCSPSAIAEPSTRLQPHIARMDRLFPDTSSPAPRPNGNWRLKISRSRFSPRLPLRRLSGGFGKQDWYQPRLGRTELLTLCERQTAL